MMVVPSLWFPLFFFFLNKPPGDRWGSSGREDEEGRVCERGEELLLLADPPSEALREPCWPDLFSQGFLGPPAPAGLCGKAAPVDIFCVVFCVWDEDLLVSSGFVACGSVVCCLSSGLFVVCCVLCVS